MWLHPTDLPIVFQSSATWPSMHQSVLSCISQGLVSYIPQILVSSKPQSLVNIVFDRVGRKDPVTKGMEIAVHWMGLDIDVQFWSQHVSFFLVGIIIVTSIRGFVLTLTKVRVVSIRLRNSPEDGLTVGACLTKVEVT